MTQPGVNQPLIVPSVLPADFAYLGAAVRELCEAGVDRIQWDVMDGVFVPDLVLAMTVNPGFGGQAYIPAVEPKIARLRRMIDDSGLPVELEVDGGITAETIPAASAAGAEVFISGSWLYAYPDGKAAAVERLRIAAAASAQHGEAA